jgi:hypothetical protein
MQRLWVRAEVPSKSRVSDTSRATNASPRPLTRPDMPGHPLPNGVGRKSKSQSSANGESARRRRAGEASFSTPLDFDGALGSAPRFALRAGGLPFWNDATSPKYQVEAVCKENLEPFPRSSRDGRPHYLAHAATPHSHRITPGPHSIPFQVSDNEQLVWPPPQG